jgi:hypothetical protein
MRKSSGAPAAHYFALYFTGRFGWGFAFDLASVVCARFFDDFFAVATCGFFAGFTVAFVSSFGAGLATGFAEAFVTPATRPPCPQQEKCPILGLLPSLHDMRPVCAETVVAESSMMLARTRLTRSDFMETLVHGRTP